MNGCLAVGEGLPAGSDRVAVRSADPHLLPAARNDVRCYVRYLIISRQALSVAHTEAKVPASGIVAHGSCTKCIKIGFGKECQQQRPYPWTDSVLEPDSLLLLSIVYFPELCRTSSKPSHPHGDDKRQ